MASQFLSTGSFQPVANAYARARGRRQDVLVRRRGSGERRRRRFARPPAQGGSVGPHHRSTAYEPEALEILKFE